MKKPKKKIIKKPYKLTPLNKEIEKVKRVLWLVSHKKVSSYSIFKMDSKSLKAYYQGLCKAKVLVQQKIKYAKKTTKQN